MAFKYFKDCVAFKEGHAIYRKLSMTNHPDRGGDEETFKEIQNEYEVWLKTEMREVVEEATGTDYKSRPHDEKYYDTLNCACTVLNVDVETIGDWIWVFNAAPLDIPSLAMRGFAWSAKHQGYYWADWSKHNRTSHPQRRRHAYSTDNLRSMWGSDQKKDKLYMGEEEDENEV